MPATFDTQPIAHYELEDVISKTSTSTVYLAQQTQLKRTVCVKVVAPSLASQPVFRERFLAEATLLAGLSHPHIVTIYEVGETDGTLFISLEHIDGGDIGGAIRDGIDAPTALRIVRDVALALQFAHEHRFVHGDIRPANILMTAAGRVVLTDFCIAKVLRHSGIVTTAGQSGSPGFMAPEQFDNAATDTAGRADGIDIAAADHRADLYSLGVVMFFMLAGQLPFTGSSTAIARQQHAGRVPKLPEASVRYQPLIERLLQKDPARRFQSAGQLIVAINQILPVETMPLAQAHPDQPARSDGLSPGFRITTLGILVLLCIVAVGSALLTR